MFVIIPAKPFNESKTRLSTVLSLPQRINLSRYLLQRTVQLADQIGDVVVISRSGDVRRQAKQSGAWALVESKTGLNRAIRQATDWVVSQPGQSILILPADLPLLTLTDLTELSKLGQESQSLVIAPCHRGQGTNALLLRPPNLIDFSFGEDSFKKHLQAGLALGLVPIIYHSATVALDLDYPEDWQKVSLQLELPVFKQAFRE